ncbi:MAG TPA: outer membrane protein assembly factor BamD [Vicinamibacteria bacterium]|nr:outer membrane protein assembly factor BamD [Vicinamibacteria bacterium]
MRRPRAAGLRRAAAAGLLAAACASGQPDIATLTSNSDQVIWEAGEKAMEKREWDSARQHFRRIVDAFPQSRYAPGARLALGDTWIKEGGTAQDILAIGAYREFLTLYPSHPRSDYAQFQVAEAYFRQRSGPDRDQTQTLHALEEYQRLLELYPSSPYAENARERIGQARQSLARAEYLAGYFYQRTRQYCRAALARYEGILKEYPDFEDLDLVLLHMAECLHATGRTAEALPHLSRLLEDFPQSEEAETARGLMAEWSQQVPAAPAPAETALPPITPSPTPGASEAPADPVPTPLPSPLA